MNNLNLGKRVKELRKRKGISQEVLAEESGLSLRTIQRIENDETEPRGDTIKRLAVALDTSPDEIIDWEIQEDQNYLMLMSLSALGFLFFPLLGIIIPLILWIFKKDKVKGVNKLGKSILNFQILWTLVLFLYYGILIAILFKGNAFSLIPRGRYGVFVIYIPLLVLYGYNLIVIIYNAVRVYSGKSVRYKPALRILK